MHYLNNNYIHLSINQTKKCYKIEILKLEIFISIEYIQKDKRNKFKVRFDYDQNRSK